MRAICKSAATLWIISVTAWPLGMIAQVRPRQKVSLVQSRNLGSTHGTVNIWVANRNGLVAVTDSRISLNGSPVGEGQKLFKLDDHTICTIANWYSFPGPTLDGADYGESNAISNIINYLVKHGAISGRLKEEEKLAIIARSVAFTMTTMQKIEEARGVNINSAESEITIGSYEERHFKILSTTVIPATDTLGNLYKATPFEVMDVPDGVTYLVKGMTGIAEPILRNPSLDRSGNAFITRYRNAMTNEHGSNLTVEDLRQVALALEAMTSKTYPKIVGGTVELASMIEDNLEMTNPLADQPEPRDIIFNLFLTMDNVGVTRTASILSAPGRSALVMNGIFISLSAQPIDDMLFIGNTFINTQLTYRGSHHFVLDESNTLRHCELQVDDKISLQSPEILLLQKNFPDLKIVHSIYDRAGGW